MAFQLELPHCRPASAEVPSAQELTENVQAWIARYRRDHPRRPLMAAPFEPAEYTTRNASLEICTVAICPAYPEYMAIGTYALVKKDESTEYAHQIRKGHVCLTTVASTFKSAYPGMLPPFLDTKDFACAVLDIHFHPKDDTLLGVATSNASIHFFRLIKHASVIDRRVELKLIALGSAKIAEDDEHGLVHLITQFTWLPRIDYIGRGGSDDKLVVTLAATESSGRVQLTKFVVPAITSIFDIRTTEPTPVLQFEQVYLRKHDQEAWTVATFDIPAPSGLDNRIVLSGGDDSALRASLVDLALFTTRNPSPHSPSVASLDISLLASPVIDRWTDRRNYNAGVVAILPLTPTVVTAKDEPDRLETVIPLLTGSYDETVRLYAIDPRTIKQTLVTDLKLGGGVWRLNLMDEYEFELKHNCVVLASCMHAGARILRVSYDRSHLPEREGRGWSIEIIAKFTAGHESMVYDCDFRRDGATGGYTVVSTSFYDMAICVWQFVDEVKKRTVEEVEKERDNSAQVERGNTNTSWNMRNEVSGFAWEDGEWKMK